MTKHNRVAALKGAPDDLAPAGEWAAAVFVDEIRPPAWAGRTLAVATVTVDGLLRLDLLVLPGRERGTVRAQLPSRKEGAAWRPWIVLYDADLQEALDHAVQVAFDEWQAQQLIDAGKAAQG